MKHLMWDPEVLISQPNNVCIFLRKKNQLGWTHKKNHIFTLPQFSTLLSYYEYVLFADDLILCLETPQGLQKLVNGLFKYCSKWYLILSLTQNQSQGLQH